MAVHADLWVGPSDYGEHLLEVWRPVVLHSIDKEGGRAPDPTFHAAHQVLSDTIPVNVGRQLRRDAPDLAANASLRGVQGESEFAESRE